MLSDLLSTLKSQFCSHHLQGLTLCSPRLVCNVFGYCPLSLREITDVLVFCICGPGITIDESAAVLEAAPADEDVGNGS